MRTRAFLFTLFTISVVSCSQSNQKGEKIPPFDVHKFGEETSIKGKVNNWPTDTVYLSTLPFHSPYSSMDDFVLLSSDNTFKYTFDAKKEPFVLFLTPERKFLDLRNDLLFENLTEEYYRGYCKKFYTDPITTYLIEPGTETIVELTKTKRYGETLIKFLNTNKYNSEYYQTTFELDQKFDEILDERFDEALTDLTNIDKAIINLQKKQKEILTSLEQNKTYLSPLLYNYTKAEIEFGARKEFLRYLLLDHKDNSSKLFENGISKGILTIVEFDKENINHETLISQEYNEFIELYLIFKNSVQKNKLTVYKQFDAEKFEFALQELPQVSKYYYLANNLLQSNNIEANKKLYERLILEYPEGELNNKLIEKYQ
jgi:hypothetical protein